MAIVTKEMKNDKLVISCALKPAVTVLEVFYYIQSSDIQTIIDEYIMYILYFQGVKI